jgi:hypothetical protein
LGKGVGRSVQDEINKYIDESLEQRCNDKTCDTFYRKAKDAKMSMHFQIERCTMETLNRTIAKYDGHPRRKSKVSLVIIAGTIFAVLMVMAIINIVVSTEFKFAQSERIEWQPGTKGRQECEKCSSRKVYEKSMSTYLFIWSIPYFGYLFATVLAGIILVMYQLRRLMQKMDRASNEQREAGRHLMQRIDMISDDQKEASKKSAEDFGWVIAYSKDTEGQLIEVLGATEMTSKRQDILNKSHEKLRAELVYAAKARNNNERKLSKDLKTATEANLRLHQGLNKTMQHLKADQEAATRDARDDLEDITRMLLISARTAEKSQTDLELRQAIEDINSMEFGTAALKILEKLRTVLANVNVRTSLDSIKLGKHSLILERISERQETMKTELTEVAAENYLTIIKEAKHLEEKLQTAGAASAQSDHLVSLVVEITIAARAQHADLMELVQTRFLSLKDKIAGVQSEQQSWNQVGALSSALTDLQENINEGVLELSDNMERHLAEQEAKEAKLEKNAAELGNQFTKLETAIEQANSVEKVRMGKFMERQP